MNDPTEVLDLQIRQILEAAVVEIYKVLPNYAIAHPARAMRVSAKIATAIRPLISDLLSDEDERSEEVSMQNVAWPPKKKKDSSMESLVGSMATSTQELNRSGHLKNLLQALSLAPKENVELVTSIQRQIDKTLASMSESTSDGKGPEVEDAVEIGPLPLALD